MLSAGSTARAPGCRRAAAKGTDRRTAERGWTGGMLRLAEVFFF